MPNYTRTVRKAFETQLKTSLAVQAAGLAIWFPDIAFDPNAHEEYVRFSFHPAKPIVWTMGTTPRISGAGFAKMMVVTKGGVGQDRNDTIAGYIAVAFPYNLNLVRSGIRAIIDVNHHGTFAVTNGWGESPVDVYWSVERTT